VAAGLVSPIIYHGGKNKVKIIFVVDDNNVNLLSADETLSKYYRVYTMPSVSSMIELLENIIPDLIMLDILMPETNGFEALKYLKSNSRYADIPVMFVTSRDDSATEALGLEMGAVDFICKPFSGPVLLNRIKTHLEIEDIIRKRTDSLKKLKNGIVSVLAKMVEARDVMTNRHIERITSYIRLLLEAMLERKVYFDEIVQWDLEMILLSTRLHDIGKIVITDIILNKPGRLTAEEFDTIKNHVTAGEKIINNIIAISGDDIFLQYAKWFTAYHHERWDGLGYPYGLKGEEIPLHGRIMAIADVYDALVSNRPYKQAFTHEDAKKIMIENKGKHFDPKLVDIFMEIESLFAGVN
jgi:putative two-component system response regulator